VGLYGTGRAHYGDQGISHCHLAPVQDIFVVLVRLIVNANIVLLR